MEKRKAFNFYKSYYEVAMKLSVEDRCEFLTALMIKQFEDIEPSLSGMADFAYISQKHTIESQVEGYKSKISSTPSVPPTQPPSLPPTEPPTYVSNAIVMTTEPPSVPPTQPPSVQEQEKEKGKEKEKDLEKDLVEEKIIDISTENYDDIIFGNKSVIGLDEELDKWLKK